MQSDSATESDDESSIGVNDVERNSTHFSFQIMERDVQDERLLHEATLEALEKITLFDLPAVQRDSSLHQDILSASDDILYFLDRGCARVVDDVNAVDDLFLLHRLVNVKFLSILFRHRKTSRVIAAKATTPNAATTIVCWVDVVLAKLSMFILHVAGGFSRHPLAPCSEFIQYQREEDCVKAATQMPEKWESVIDVIGSNKTSPAAIRLATRLVFAAYVMAPQLNGNKHWVDPDVRPEDVMVAILRNAHHKPLNGFCGDHSMPIHDEEDRANYAMIVSIFSACQVAKGGCSADLPQFPLRIQGMGYLLTMIQISLHGEVGSCGQNIIPYEDLDLAQTILVRWGVLVPWSWEAWNDQRIAHVECIADLTIAWLYHLNSPFCVGSSLDCLAQFTVYLHSTISNNDSRFGAIILQILHRFRMRLQEAHTSDTRMDLSLGLAVVLQKSCSATIQLLRSTLEYPSADIDAIVQSVCRSLVALFCLLGDEEQDLNTKDIILEALTLVSPTILGSTFQVLRLDSHLQIDAKVNESIAKCNRQFTMIRENPGSSTLTQYLLTVKSTLSFLALMWHYEIESCIAPRPVSLLLSTTMTIVQSLKHSYHLPGVRDALLTAVSVSGGACEIDEEMFSVLAIQSECSNFIAASAYSHRIMATEENHDPLLLAETWNYLRDVLLLIISRRCAEDDEALALLVSPIICTAMTKIAQTTSPAAGLILTSPWTMSLCSELQSITANKNPPEARYFASLQERLAQAGTMLLDQITWKLERSSLLKEIHGFDARLKLERSPLKESHGFESRLVFCYASTGSRLVLVPQI